jgi:sugar porter (SP) family MFS transporter
MEISSKERCTGFLFFVVTVAAFGGFLFGYHTGIISGALIFLTPAFQLSILQQGTVVSIILIGALLGALVAGMLADKIGRKRTIAITSALFVIGAAMIALSDTYEMLLIGRFVSGIGVGIISLSAPLYLAEISPPRFRGMFVSGYQLAITIGILASFFINYVFSIHADWRWMFAIGIFPALFQMVALFFLPETPSWLFKHGLHEHAILTLSRLRKDKDWIHQVETMKSAASPQKKGAWKVLFSPKLRFVLVIGVLLSAFQQITGINTVIYYAPKIFETAGFTSASGAILATLGVGIINVLSTAFSVWILDRIGRRKLLLIGIAGMALSLGFLAFAFFVESTMIGKIAMLSLMAYVAFFAIGLGPVTWVVISEIFPLKVRGKAMTVATFVNWFFNYLVSLTFLDLIAQIKAEGTFLIFALLSGLAFWFVFRYIPETKGKSLEEIETLLIK